MEFDGQAWLAELRDVLRGGVIPATGTARNAVRLAGFELATDQVNALRKSARGEASRVIKARTGKELDADHWNDILDAFGPKIEQLVKYSSRTPFPRPILEMDDDESQSRIIRAYFDDFVALSTRWGTRPSIKALKRLPILYLTASVFDEFRADFPDFPYSDAQRFAIANPKGPAAAARKALDAVDDLLALKVGLTRAEARRFAIGNPRDPLAAANKALEAVDDLLVLDVGWTRAQALYFAIHNPKDPVAAAGKALEAVDDLLALDVGLTRAEARYFAISNPTDPVAAAAKALEAVDDLLALDVDWTRTEARYFAIGNPRDPLAAANKALEAVDDLLALNLNWTRKQARYFAVHNPNDPVTAARKAFDAVDDLLALDVGWTRADARSFAISNPTDPLAAANKALEAVDDLLALDVGWTRAEARHFAIGNPRDPLGAAGKALDAVDDLLALNLGLTRKQARKLAVTHPKDPVAAANNMFETGAVGDAYETRQDPDDGPVGGQPARRPPTRPSPQGPVFEEPEQDSDAAGAGAEAVSGAVSSVRRILTEVDDPVDAVVLAEGFDDVDSISSELGAI